MRRAPFDPLFFTKEPLFWPIARAASGFAELCDWPPVSEYNARVSGVANILFREQPKKPRGKRRKPVGARDLYDGRIIEEGWVPTRPANWHDFLNMLVWATFPKAKRSLHARQHRAQLSRVSAPTTALPNARTREQDALALLDEGGIVVLCREDKRSELALVLGERNRDAARAMFERGAAKGVIFGHAVYEELVFGHTTGWCAGWLGPLPEGPTEDCSLIRAADRALSAKLEEHGSFDCPSALVRVDLPLVRP